MNFMKAGDKVRMNDEQIIKINFDLPSWYSKDIFTITKITNAVDDENYPIVEIDRPLNNGITKMSSFYLTSIKEERKKKIYQINESNL